MAVNDADRSRDERTETRQESAAGSGVAPGPRREEARTPDGAAGPEGASTPEDAPTPESEAAAMPVSEPSAPGVWDADTAQRAAQAGRAADREDVSGVESAGAGSAVPPVPDSGPVPEPDAGPAPSRDDTATVRAGGPAAGTSGIEPSSAGASAGASSTDASGAARNGATEGGLGQSRSPQEPSELRQHLTARTTWLRFVYMVLFVVLWGLTRVVVGAVVIMQFLWVLFSGESNPRLAILGQTLATYSYEVILYLTFNTERQPFPFSDWPSGAPKE